MGKASDTELGKLHGKLANAMMLALESSDTAISLIDEYAEELPPAVLSYLQDKAKANPALLTAVSKFLKDNDITCAIEDNEQLSELQALLKNKQRKRVGNVVSLDEVE